MSFENMTLELNIFYLCKQPRDVDDEVHEINLIESFVEDTSLLTFYFDPLEACLAHSHEIDDDAQILSQKYFVVYIVLPFDCT